MRVRTLLTLLAFAVFTLPVGSIADDTLQLAKPAVDAAFAKGAPLVETPLYKVHASRRDTPGLGEVHSEDTDILYVLSGSATFVTGGRLVDPSAISPSERRGARIEGGTARRISAGDVLIVPNGTPHWFQAVDGPVVYYVVKVTAAEATR